MIIKLKCQHRPSALSSLSSALGKELFYRQFILVSITLSLVGMRVGVRGLCWCSLQVWRVCRGGDPSAEERGSQQSTVPSFTTCARVLPLLCSAAGVPHCAAVRKDTWLCGSTSFSGQLGLALGSSSSAPLCLHCKPGLQISALQDIWMWTPSHPCPGPCHSLWWTILPSVGHRLNFDSDSGSNSGS